MKINLTLSVLGIFLLIWVSIFLQPCEAVSEVSKVITSNSFRNATRNFIVNYGRLPCPVLRHIYYEINMDNLFVSCGNSPTNYSYFYKIENYPDLPTIKQINKSEYQVNQIIH